MLPFEYARSALQIGLQLEQDVGVNPFKFGMIGSTDAHTSLATTREENYWGQMPYSEPSGDRWEDYWIRALSGDDALPTYEGCNLAPGLAAVGFRAGRSGRATEAGWGNVRPGARPGGAGAGN